MLGGHETDAVMNGHLLTCIDVWVCGKFLRASLEHLVIVYKLHVVSIRLQK